MKLAVWTLAVSCVLVTAFALFDAGIIRFNYPSQARFPVRGIDVSHHQGSIDWPQVASEASIKFVYIKATEGGYLKDPKFGENWRGSKEAGLVRGAYHFFTFWRSGESQAKNFLATVPLEPDALPMAIDLEFRGNCSARPSAAALVAEVNAFLSAVKDHYPQKPVFYVTPEFFNRYLEDETNKFPDHYLWLRNIFYEPVQENCERWSFWQFADRARVKGITGPVDLNVFCGDQTTFSTFGNSTSSN